MFFRVFELIGWGLETIEHPNGETTEDVPYWIITNTWNPDWGDDGIVKFLRRKCKKIDPLPLLLCESPQNEGEFVFFFFIYLINNNPF